MSSGSHRLDLLFVRRAWHAGILGRAPATSLVTSNAHVALQGFGVPTRDTGYLYRHGVKCVFLDIPSRPRGGIWSYMVQVIPEQPLEAFTSTWCKVSHCLDCTADWACAQQRPLQRRMLKRSLSILLQYGQWGATPLDVPPHPKIPGLCLIPASYEEATEWPESTVWNKRYLCPDLLLASRWLNILAWHFSTRENRRREVAWCRTASWLLREARRSLLPGT